MKTSKQVQVCKDPYETNTVYHITYNNRDITNRTPEQYEVRVTAILTSNKLKHLHIH